jgi:hypothetical protein
MTTIDGIDLTTSQGDKFPGDLKLRVRGSDGQWRDVHMALALYLVDFFTENERERRPHMGYWTQNGDTYFVRECIAAVRDGWRSVAERIERQRRARS